jgi:glycine hydroxymethyltransferase
MLAQAGIVCNWNCIPFDPRPPMETSGIRLGTPALTTRGMDITDMQQVASWIDAVLNSGGDAKILADVHQGVLELCKQHPVPNYNL